MRNYILDLIQNNKDLPSLPEITVKLEELLADPDSKLKDIAKLIETEPVLSGKIITLSNSVHYRGLSKIITIPMAIRRLGPDFIPFFDIYLLIEISLSHFTRSICKILDWIDNISYQ